ncbi:hypothetical protein GN156_15055 [bacterium LRH843]|nr:hypothetical protein [bacterium LRH843]
MSPEFETPTGDKLVGQENKVGIVRPEFKAGEVAFWGDEKTIKAAFLNWLQ